MREFLSANIIANEIRMSRINYSGAFLLVEGKMSDLPFFRHYINNLQCQLIPSHGKDNVIEIIRILDNEKFNGILGIIDADFWHVKKEKSPSNNLLLTDTHDLETMLIASPSYNKLLTELGSERKISSFTKNNRRKPLTRIIESSISIGVLRLISLS